MIIHMVRRDMSTTVCKASGEKLEEVVIGSDFLGICLGMWVAMSKNLRQDETYLYKLTVTNTWFVSSI